MRYACAILLAAAFLPACIFGQGYDKKTYITIPVQTTPVIDGIIDEPVWDTGNWNSDFLQYSPLEGAAPRQKTEFTVLYDNNNIYIAIKAYDTAPDSITNRITRRDNIDGDDVGITLDSYNDQKTGFCFFVSSAGVKEDYISVDDGLEEDNTWDPIWFVKTHIWDWGWSAEMRIPFDQLRFSKTEVQSWGIDVMRTLFRYNETDMWQLIPRNATGYVHLLGGLQGIKDIKPRKQFDLIPYSVLKTETYQHEAGNPWRDGCDMKANAGLDAKVGLTNNTILCLAVNPDFGQVEADPSEVNLTAFETFFTEKRPFFVESNNITSFNLGLGSGSIGNDNLFYSRRIGRTPRLSPSLNNNEVSHTHFTTPILGAAKITSKTAGGISVGIVEGLTAEVNTKIIDTITKVKRSSVAEPMTNYTVERIQRDINGGKTIIGGILTNTTRFTDNTTKNYFSHTATTGGLDFTQYFGKMNWLVRLRTAFSNINGSANAIAITQTSTIHNFARPDADYLTYNPERTSLTGTGGNLMAGKLGGNLQILYMGTWKSPQLELNDLGYLQTADRYIGLIAIYYNIYKPHGIFMRNSFSGNFMHVLDFGGTLQQLVEGFQWDAYYKSLWKSSFNVQTSGNRISNAMLRGGPSIKLPGYIYFIASFVTSRLEQFSLEADGSYKMGFQNRSEESRILDLKLTYKPSASLSFSAEPEADIEHNELQYVAGTYFNYDSSQPRYIMATLDQKTVSLSLRVEYNVTPELSVQYWGQPFISTGKYTGFKKAENTLSENYSERFHTFSIRETASSTGQIYYNPAGQTYMVYENSSDILANYSFAKPDFTVSEFLSNMVIKWEFRPGSTVYLVWSQTRDYTTSDSSFKPGEQISDLFSKNKPYNVFLVKFSYRFRL
jgi:hypothetical protein